MPIYIEIDWIYQWKKKQMCAVFYCWNLFERGYVRDRKSIWKNNKKGGELVKRWNYKGPVQQRRVNFFRKFLLVWISCLPFSLSYQNETHSLSRKGGRLVIEWSVIVVRSTASYFEGLVFKPPHIFLLYWATFPHLQVAFLLGFFNTESLLSTDYEALRSRIQLFMTTAARIANPVTLLTWSWEVFGSNVGRNTDCPNWGRWQFSSSSPHKFKKSTLN
jgi:hypothetical protein